MKAKQEQKKVRKSLYDPSCVISVSSYGVQFLTTYATNHARPNFSHAPKVDHGKSAKNMQETMREMNANERSRLCVRARLSSHHNTCNAATYLLAGDAAKQEGEITMVKVGSSETKELRC